MMTSHSAVTSASEMTSASGAVTYIQLPSHVVEESVVFCQQMLKTLQTAHISHRQTADQTTQTEVSDPSVELEKLSMENNHLTQKLKEVATLNIHWQQMYNDQQKQMNDLKSRLDSVLSQQQQQQQQLSAVATTAERRDDGTVETGDQCTHELHTRSEQDRQLQQAQQDSQQLQTTINSLTEQLETAQTQSQSTAEMLQAQIIVYREDFEAERRDREMAQSKLVELQNQLHQLHKHSDNSSRPRTDRNQLAVEPSRRTRQQLNQLYIGRGASWQMDGGVDEVDCVTDSSRPASAPARVSTMATNTAPARMSTMATSRPTGSSGSINSDDTLRCLRCHRVFTRDNHLQLLDHMDECANSS